MAWTVFKNYNTLDLFCVLIISAQICDFDMFLVCSYVIMQHGCEQVKCL